jgi:phage shock protein PspC (stress-responsive transcriptional regulator)
VKPRSSGAILHHMNTESANPYESSLAGARAWFAEQGLTRPSHDRWIGGVVSGFARRFHVNVLVARVAALIGVIVLTPLLYLPLWILMPAESSEPASTTRSSPGPA